MVYSLNQVKLNSDNGVGNNNNTFENVFGSMSGYATNFSGAIAQ